jgi:hypothetical protein
MLSKLMTDWSDSNQQQSVLIDIELKEYFKYIKNEFIALKEVNTTILFNLFKALS